MSADETETKELSEPEEFVPVLDRTDSELADLGFDQWLKEQENDEESQKLQFEVIQGVGTSALGVGPGGDTFEEEDPWAFLPKHLRKKKKVTYIRNHSDLKIISKTTRFRLLLGICWKHICRNWILTLIEVISPILAVAVIVAYGSLVFESEHSRIYSNNYTNFAYHASTHAFNNHNCTQFIFSPNNPLVKRVMEDMKLTFDDNKYKFLLEHESIFKKMSGFRYLCAGISFDNSSFRHLVVRNEPMLTFSKEIKFSLRLPAVHRQSAFHEQVKNPGSFIAGTAEWLTHKIYPDHLVSGPRNEGEETGGTPEYFDEAFLLLQTLVSEKIIHRIYVDGMSTYATPEVAEHSYEARTENLDFRLNRFPYPAYKVTSIVRLIHDYLPLALVAAYALPFLIIVNGAVLEKQSGIRVQLLSVGIPYSYHRLTWIVRSLCIHIPTMGFITFILTTDWTKGAPTPFDDGKIIRYTEGKVLFLILVAYLFKTITVAMLLVTFFHRASTATISCGLFWLACYIPYYFVKGFYNSFALWQKFCTSLLANTGVALSLHLIANAEARGDEITMKTLFKVDKKKQGQDLTVGVIIVVQLVSGILDMILALYINMINPEKQLQRLPWYYFLKMWYWRGQPTPDYNDSDSLPPHLRNAPSLEERFPYHYEEDLQVRRRKELQIERLSKYYGAERVLHKINLNFYEGQATAIIGESGAGKSVLLSIIAGLTTASSGHLVVSRHLLSKNREGALSFVGYCRTTNVFYPFLTVRETLEIYCALKCSGTRLERWDEVNRFVKEAMLEDYENTLVRDLTNSSQRILMVACAFIGGSRVVLLDDPTAEMNASQKRMTWALIDNQKKHRAVIVATHCINEGDRAIDKIVYLQKGEVACSGSVQFMQQKFNGGYSLVITKKFFEPCDTEAINNLLTKRLGENWSNTETEETIQYFLPDNKTSAFPGVFRELKGKKKALGIEDFCCTYSTLDEVVTNIRKIAMVLGYDPENRKTIYKGVSEMALDKSYKRLSGISYHWKCFVLLFRKNSKFHFRRPKSLFMISLAPLLFVLLFLIYNLQKEGYIDPPALVMDTKNYSNGSPEIVVSCDRAVYEGLFLCKSLLNVINNFHNGTNVTKLKKKELIKTYVAEQYHHIEEEDQLPLFGIEISKNENSKKNVMIVGYFNNQPLHVSPLVVSIMDNMVLDYMIRHLSHLYPLYVSDFGIMNYSVKVTNHPLLYSHSDRVNYSGYLLSPGFFLGLFVTTGFAVFVAYFVVLPIKEREFHHIQMLAGVHPLSFWGSNYLWNYLFFLVVSTVACFLIFGMLTLGDTHSWFTFDLRETFHLFVLLQVYGLTQVFFVGAWCLMPHPDSTVGFTRTLLFFIMTGPVAMIIILAFEDFSAARSNKKVVAGVYVLRILENLFQIFPSYALGIGVFYITAEAVHEAHCGRIEVFQEKNACRPTSVRHSPWDEFERDDSEPALWSCCLNKASPFSWTPYGIGRNITAMLIILMISLLIRVFHESRVGHFLGWWWQKKRTGRWDKAVSFQTQEIYDYDVLKEMIRVQNTDEKSENLLIRHLTKEIQGQRQVNAMCVEIDRGECFCIVGAAGAGKSEAIQMISGASLPSSGDVTLAGISLTRNYREYIKRFGYCSQSPSFLTEMTGHEVLELIGTLRRIPSKELEIITTNLSLRLLFLHDLDNKISSYSVTSLKKLAAAVAMIGDPLVVILEKPAESIDLISRDYLFGCIKRLLAIGSIVILTARSVVEIEDVCTKMAILVNGTFRSFGTLPYLKALFVEGYTLIVTFTLDPKKTYFTSKSDRFRLYFEFGSETGDNGNLNKKAHICNKDICKEHKVHRDDSQFTLTDLTIFGRVASTISMPKEDDFIDMEDIVKTWDQDLIPFMDYFDRKFMGSILVDKHPGFLHYHIPSHLAHLWQLFEQMEEAKTVLGSIENYYIGKTNLDQVFINFAKGQKPVHDFNLHDFKVA